MLLLDKGISFPSMTHTHWIKDWVVTGTRFFVVFLQASLGREFCSGIFELEHHRLEDDLHVLFWCFVFHCFLHKMLISLVGRRGWGRRAGTWNIAKELHLEAPTQTLLLLRLLQKHLGYSDSLPRSALPNPRNLVLTKMLLLLQLRCLVTPWFCGPAVAEQVSSLEIEKSCFLCEGHHISSPNSSNKVFPGIMVEKAWGPRRCVSGSDNIGLDGSWFL